MYEELSWKVAILDLSKASSKLVSEWFVITFLLMATTIEHWNLST